MRRGLDSEWLGSNVFVAGHGRNACVDAFLLVNSIDQMADEDIRSLPPDAGCFSSLASGRQLVLLRKRLFWTQIVWEDPHLDFFYEDMGEGS